jgi:acetyltransferase-like isoleucine patch superfamily enzyme
MNLRAIFYRLHIKLLEKSSNNTKIKYLRKQGMKIGENCVIGTMSFSTEPYLIEIGDHVAIADDTEIVTHDGGVWCFRDEIKNADLFGKVKIGNNVFIGNNCTILPNTTIGDNCIIGSGSVLRGKFPENSVIMGNPAKVVTNINVQRFLYKQNPDLLLTKHLSRTDKTNFIKTHFGIEK